MNIEFKNCLKCVCGRSELYKVNHDIWVKAGVNSNNPCACLSCLELALGRDLVASDFDLAFPWWNAERPCYYDGFKDGLFGYNSPPPATDQDATRMYSEGRLIGHRYYVNSRDPHNL